ncbi:MAG: sensor histidine kinase [Janthinobacterium lividum]
MNQSSPDEVVKSVLQVSSARLKRQHELAVEFALSALRIRDIDRVIDDACRIVSEGVRARFVKVLRYSPDTQQLILQAGRGWNPEEIGRLALSADDASPAGYAYASSRPVISNHLGDEHRFRTPEFLARHGIKRAINVPIRGIPEAYGVLEADSPDDEDFTETDIVFLEAIANVISMTRERIGAELDEYRNELFSESVLNASTDCIKVMSITGKIEFMNEHGLQQMRIEDFAGSIQGHGWDTFWPREEAPKVRESIERALAGESMRFEGQCPTLKGEPMWWDVSVAPIRGASGSIERIVAVSRDITERHANEEKLEALVRMQETKLDSSELMMKEVHHRVRNSLQLVQTLLALQGNLSGDKAVANHLQAAAMRVTTVASVHQRLYEDSGAEATNASVYLTGLIADLRVLSVDREIVFHAPSIVVPAGRLAPLGLVTAELVTNALKYGKGKISVALARHGDDLQLTVDDEGRGFPDTFPKPQGTGLGMRLVQTYAGRGPKSVTVDRSVPFSRIQVVFKSS